MTREARTIYECWHDLFGDIPHRMRGELDAAHSLYPNDWIEDAFAESARVGKPSWVVAKRTLQEWLTLGRRKLPPDRPMTGEIVDNPRGRTWRDPRIIR